MNPSKGSIVRRQRQQAQAADIAYMYNGVNPKTIRKDPVLRGENLRLIQMYKDEIKNDDTMQSNRWGGNSSKHIVSLVLFVAIFNTPYVLARTNMIYIQLSLWVWCLLGVMMSSVWIAAAITFRESRLGKRRIIDALEQGLYVRPHSTETRIKERLLRRWRWGSNNYPLVRPIMFLCLWIVIPASLFFFQEAFHEILEQSLSRKFGIGGL